MSSNADNVRIQIYKTPTELARHLAQQFLQLVQRSADEQKNASITLSGGSTPKILFQHIAELARHRTLDWSFVHLFWGDERCVPPEHEDSNYGMAKSIFLDKISIPGQNIHRIPGEQKPEEAAILYSGEILQFVSASINYWPNFDWILLGLGEDGHTASIFPNADFSLIEYEICKVVTHPASRQKRITISLPVINFAKRVTFLVTGQSKAKIVREVLTNPHGDLPAQKVKPGIGLLEFFLDEAAASLLGHSQKI